MAKFLNVAIAPSVDTGTTDGVPSGANDLIDSGQNFLTTVSVGDLVHNTTDDAWHVVSAVVDDDNLTLVTGTVATAKAYVIYDGNSSNYTNQLVSAEGIKLAAQATASTTTLTYASGGADVLTITHGIVTGVAFRTAVEAAIVKAFSVGNRPSATAELAIPSGVVVTGIAIA